MSDLSERAVELRDEILNSGASDGATLRLLSLLRAEAANAQLRHALAQALMTMRDKRWAQIIGDYYGRGHLSYAGQLDEKFGPIEKILARAQEGKTK